MDFGQVVEPNILFTPENAQQTLCRSIPLMDDELVENAEHFLVELSTTDENVVLGPPIQVTILDNDSELTHMFARCL